MWTENFKINLVTIKGCWYENHAEKLSSTAKRFWTEHTSDLFT